MLERMKRALVDSYVGAIALGYLLAQDVSHLVGVFSSPLAGWVTRRQYRDIVPRNGSLPGFSLQDALPELVRFLALLLVWYLLVRWLYFKPIGKAPNAEPNPEQAD